MALLFKKVRSGAKIPIRMTDNAAGFDLFATEQVLVNPYQTVQIDTGIAVEFPKGVYGAIKGRSSLALQQIFYHSGTNKL